MNRRGSFSSALIVSSVVHSFLFIGFAIAPKQPQYGVQTAPSSIEMVFIKEEPDAVIEEMIEPEELMMAIDPTDALPEVIEEPEPEKQEPEEELPPVINPPQQGAIAEAKPDYLNNPAPVYPLFARRQGWSGVVLLRVLVTQEGVVGDIEIKKSSGRKILDEAALKAVKHWRFLPAQLGGMELESWVNVPVRFSLEAR